MSLAFSQACENNKSPILSVLNSVLSDSTKVLEIGSGTGQHGVYFAEKLPHLTWLTSDLEVNHPSILARIAHSKLPNIHKPLTLDLNKQWHHLKSSAVDAVFTANTLHIVSISLVNNFFEMLSTHLLKDGILCIYGPFKYDGKFTSASNEGFNAWLQERDKDSGVRDFEYIVKLASNAGLTLINDHVMPANNQLLVFRKTH